MKAKAILIALAAVAFPSGVMAECLDKVKQAAVEATAQIVEAAEATGVKVSFEDERQLYESFLHDVNNCEEKH